jgi:predicted O-methyltransferase YrrM
MTSYVDEIYANIKEFSEMSYDESCFLNGLVRYFKPKKILEVGVAAGTSSCILLNAIKDDPTSMVHSVDWSKEYYKGPSKSSGWKAQELFPDHARWNLHLGFDAAEIIKDRIQGNIDFLLLDTAHVHPAETLTFLSVFPYLAKGAIVVLHDVNLFLNAYYPHPICYATKLLWDSVVADKITLSVFKNGYVHPNIAAFQISEDTNKYIENLVRSLFFPWSMKVPERILEATGVILKEKYSDEIYQLYLKSIKQNQMNQNAFFYKGTLYRPTMTFRQRMLRLKQNSARKMRKHLPSSWFLFLKKIYKSIKG